jgi:cytoskeletal protein RodZ
VAPTPPPPETDHKTFELQTVKIMPAPDMDTSRVADPAERNPDPGLRQADIPTVLSTRIQRRRSWTMGVVLVVLGVAAGLGILALAKATRVEPIPADSSEQQPATTATSATVTSATVTEVLAESAPTTAEPPPLPSQPAPEPVQPAAARSDVPAIKPTSKSSAKPDAPASTKTIPIPLGPPEF